MQVLIPRTSKVSMALYTSIFFILWFNPNFYAKKATFPVPKIVFHCVDWVKDTLPSYDLNFVRNNPRCIGNPTVLASPKTAAESPQVLPNASWRSRVGAGICNLEPTAVNLDSIRNLGFVYASVDDVEGNPKPDLRWSDEVRYYSCTEMQQNGGIYARILRKWTASYQNLQKDTIQEILFVQPNLEQFVFGANNGEIIPDNFDQVITYQACSGDKSLIQKEKVTPFGQSYFSTDLKPKFAFIDEADGRYGVKIQDRDFPTCGSRGVKIDRMIYVFDSCQGKYIDTFRVLIKIGDFQGPKFIKTKELPEIHVNSSDGKAVFGLNRKEFLSRFGITIEECLLGNISARLKVKDRYIDGVLIAENVWDDLPNATSNAENRVSISPGHYRIYCNLFDGCFNYSVDSFEFIVKNELGPVPICINGLSIESLLPDGQGGGTFTLKANDFVAAPIYDPNGQGPDTLGGKKLITHYSINRIGQAVDSSQKEIKLTCVDVGKVIILELHAWDRNGRDGFCTTYVEVQNARKICFDEFGYFIYGQIFTEANAGVQNVNVDLSGAHHSANAKTVKTGNYSLVNLKRDEYYTLTPKLDDNPLNGVSTYDIVLIQKHILNIQALNSPFKMIAADVNNSRSISTLDIIQLRKLILGIDTKFSNNRSWRFINAGYIFPSPSLNPWQDKFPESISIASWSSGQSTDFVAIKIGDVNASAKVNEEE